MNILLFVLCITFILNSKTLNSEKNIYKERESCTSICSDGTPSKLIIQLSKNSLQQTFEVVIHFSCTVFDPPSFPLYLNSFRFVKLCGDNIESCEDYQNIYVKNVKDITARKYVLPISITLLMNIMESRWSYYKCNQEQLMATLTIGNRVILTNQPVSSQTDSMFSRLPDPPHSFQIILSIWRSSNQHVVDIIFNVARNITNLIPSTKSSLTGISYKNNLKPSSTSNSATGFFNGFQEIVKQNKSNKEKLSAVLTKLANIPLQYKQSFYEINSEYQKEVSKSILKIVENLFENVSTNIVNRNQSYQEFTNSYVLYSSKIKKRRSDFVIPLSVNKSETLNQFVKINILSNETTNTGSSLMTNFIRYKDMDIMNELGQIQMKAKNKSLILSNSQNVVERHKNSDIIYLSLNQHVNIKVKFKLSKLSQYNSPTWLHAFEEECGYLDKNSSWKWLVDGCRRVKESNNQYYCECNHLSNFALLFSIKTINAHHLTITHYLSIFSGIINILSLTFFLIFILFINSRDKLRLDQLNITICLLMGTIIFFIGGISSKHATVCKLSALLTQFFFLSAFNWKLIFGINVLRMIAFMKYENENRLIKYRICSIAISYGLSFIIVVISGALKWQFYGEISDDICWMENQSPAFLSFIIPIGIILVVNMVILLVIAKNLIQNFIRNKKIKVNKSNELLIFLQLFVAMGMTWIPSYFATVYLVAIYLWILFFPLQGLLMFIFVVVINKDNRTKVTSFLSEKFSSLTSKYSLTTKSQSDSKSTSNIDSRTTQLSPISPSDKKQVFPLINPSAEEKCFIPSKKLTEFPSDSDNESLSKSSFNNASTEKKLLSTPRKKNIKPLISKNDQNPNQKEILVPPQYPIFFKE